jgi:hypothetical protein
MSERTVKKVYEDEDFSVVLEEWSSILFLHCYVDNYSKSVKKKMLDIFEELKQACFYNGWEELYSYTPNGKFARMLPGAEKIDSFKQGDVEYEVFEWVLKQQ